MSTQNNALDQALDIAGSLTPLNTKALADEVLGKGVSISSGTGDTIGGTAPDMTLTDSGASFTVADIGRFLTIASAPTGANNGVFLITSFTSGTVIGYENAAGVAEAAAAATWEINQPYSLEDDLNFTRTDRRLIKGTAGHEDAIPTYERPTAVGTPVNADLTNLAGKTLDAVAVVDNRKFENATAAEGGTLITITDTSNLPHADAVDRTGVPIQDGADAGVDLATYTEIIDPATESALEVIGTAVGQIDCDSVGSAVVVLDGEDFDLDDGSNPVVTFEFDDDSSVTETPTLRRVDITAAGDEDDVRDAIIAAIEAARLASPLTFLAEANGAGLVKLTNTTPGTAGNVAITETVVSGNFVVTGMADGTATAGNRIYGRTQAGSATEPNEVEVAFRQVAKGSPLSTSVAYTWERDQPTTLDLFYGFRDRLDQRAETAGRVVLTNGIVGDADMSQDITDIRSTVGIADGVVSLAGLVTNIGNFFVFSGLGADPTVLEALNTLNAEIGDRDYTGSVLTDGETCTASHQALADAIANANIVRTIERLTVDADANVSHLLPGSIAYTLDGTDNGLNLYVIWRKQWRDPGPVGDDNDYEETDTTHITPYTKVKAGDHFNYLILM